MRTYLVGFIALGISSSAFAQAAPEPVLLPAPEPMIRPRVGLEIGGGVWGGHMSCESENGSCSGLAAAGGVNFEVSWFFNPRFGITADAWVMAHTESAFTLAQYINTVGVKWRPIPILTLQAGFGEAHATFSYSNLVVGTSGNAEALMGGASLDVIRGRRWALSLDVRAGTGFYGDSNNDGKPDITARNVGAGAELTLFGF